MRLNVPYYSQHDEALAEKYRSKACALTSLKMALDFLAEDTSSIPSLQSLFEEGKTIGGLTTTGLWIHAKLAMIARNHGIPAYTQEFRSNSPVFEAQMVAEGLKKVVLSLEHGWPVLVSVPGNRTKSLVMTHVVLLVGFEKKNNQLTGFYYHNPDTHPGEEGASQFMPIETFKREWRKLAIFVHQLSTPDTQKTF